MTAHKLLEQFARYMQYEEGLKPTSEGPFPMFRCTRTVNRSLSGQLVLPWVTHLFQRKKGQGLSTRWHAAVLQGWLTSGWAEP